jgi:hypothetical protein
MTKKARKKAPVDAGVTPARTSGSAGDLQLAVTARDGSALSPAQTQFNALMRRLEKARKRHRREQERLDERLEACGRELMPLINEVHRLNFDMIIHGLDVMKTGKFTRRRRKLLARLLRQKANDLVQDSCGLTDEQVGTMRSVVEELTDPIQAQIAKERHAGEFEFMCGMVEAVAREAGVEVDLSGLDFHGDPAEFERELQERLDAALRGMSDPPARTRVRKPTKAQLAKEQREREAEEAKKRDVKSIYKQMAKMLHPDLEPDPVRRLQKEEWMKRLTAAAAADDLRELLSIEMEWLGVESSSLAQATDEKLKGYATVLKEQLELLNFQTSQLLLEPQYAVLRRFQHPFLPVILPFPRLKSEMHDEMDRLQGMLDILRAGGPECVAMVNEWAEEMARDERRDTCPF